MHTSQRRGIRHARRAFTLVEVIVMVTVIALLMAVLITRTSGLFGRGQAQIAKTQAAKISQAMTLYLIDVGQPLPEQGFDLGVLTLRPDAGGGPQGPYLPKKSDVLDPWKQPFFVEVPGIVNADFDIVSFGADKALGGEGIDADITQ
jgi:general secretion pathway protein G